MASIHIFFAHTDDEFWRIFRLLPSFSSTLFYLGASKIGNCRLQQTYMIYLLNYLSTLGGNVPVFPPLIDTKHFIHQVKKSTCIWIQTFKPIFHVSYNMQALPLQWNEAVSSVGLSQKCIHVWKHNYTSPETRVWCLWLDQTCNAESSWEWTLPTQTHTNHLSISSSRNLYL